MKHRTPRRSFLQAALAAFTALSVPRMFASEPETEKLPAPPKPPEGELWWQSQNRNEHRHYYVVRVVDKLNLSDLKIGDDTFVSDHPRGEFFDTYAFLRCFKWEREMHGLFSFKYRLRLCFSTDPKMAKADLSNDNAFFESAERLSPIEDWR